MERNNQLCNLLEVSEIPFKLFFDKKGSPKVFVQKIKQVATKLFQEAQNQQEKKKIQFLFFDEIPMCGWEKNSVAKRQLLAISNEIFSLNEESF